MNNTPLLTSWSTSSLLTDLLRGLGFQPITDHQSPGVLAQYWKFRSPEGTPLVFENLELQDEDAAFRGKKREQVKPAFQSGQGNLESKIPIDKIPAAQQTITVIDLLTQPEGELKAHLKIRKISNIAGMFMRLPENKKSLLSQYNFHQVMDLGQPVYVLHLGPMSVDLILQFEQSK